MDRVFQLFGKLLKVDSVKIDSKISQIHHRLTVILLVSCSLFVSARQYFGDPIDCTADGVPGRLMDTYCWIHSTFTVDKRVGTHSVRPGVRPYVEGKEAVTHQKYYQWVPIILVFQAACFYAPRLLWKLWEGGRLRKLVHALGDNRDELVPSGRTAECNKRLADYFVANLHTHGTYGARFLVCECLNFINVIVQMMLLNRWFENEFRLFGLDLYRYAIADAEKRTDHMSRIFPTMAKCSFRQYGPSGTLEHLDGLCLLPLNTINERIYVFLWFWFLMLSVLSMLNLVYRLAAAMSSWVRLRLLRAKCSRAALSELIAINDEFRFGDWFLLYQLGKNCDPAFFKGLVKELSDRFIQSGDIPLIMF